jgi:hypothetical protein
MFLDEKISFFAHFPSAGRVEVSALSSFISSGLAWATVRPRSEATIENGLSIHTSSGIFAADLRR